MTEVQIPHILDGVTIIPRQLPLVPELQLYLMADDYPQNSVDESAYRRLMAQPPYWAFCWGGGQALARHVLDNPGLVQGRRVVDFGAGSGVAGIAAAITGAASVLAVDIDEDALRMAEVNARLNRVRVQVARSFVAGGDQLLLAADVGYEEAGFAAVIAHIEQGGAAIIAESRLRNLQERFPALALAACYQVRTYPDLDEAEMFDEVHIYSTV